MTGSITVEAPEPSTASSCTPAPAASATTRSRRASRRSRRSARRTASRSSPPRTRRQFTAANLAHFDVVVFMSTTGEILNAPQQAAFEGYIQAGGGFAGVHAASDTEYAWPWFGELRRRLLPQPPARNAHGGGRHRRRRRALHDRPPDPLDAHGRVVQLPASGDPRGQRQHHLLADYSPRARQVKVLATVDESTYDEQDGNTIDDDHPVAWCSNFDGGLSWYTAMGHTQASFSDAQFREHLLGGLRTAAGVAGDCGKPRYDAADGCATSRRSRSTTTRTRPMEIDIAKDGRAFYIELDGRVQMWNPTTRATTTVGTIPVTLSHENGLLGIQLAENFDDHGNIYLAYSALPGRQQPEPRLALHADRHHARPEQIIYTWQHQRQECCHTGGSLEFGANGDLYISTGDNTNPFAHGFNPTDERPGRADLGRPAHVGEHERPERQDPAHPADPERHGRPGGRDDVHDPEGNMFPPWARPRPCPRSTRWASGTRSGSTTTRRPAGS